MKKLILFTFLTFACFVHAKDVVGLVSIQTAHGSEMTYLLSKIGRLEFIDAGATYRLVSLDGSVILEEGNVDDLASLNFVDSKEISVDNGGHVTPVFEISSSQVRAADGAPIAIYDLQGRKVSNGSTQGLAKGIYIVVSKLRTAKIVVM